METQPIIIERIYNASANAVWQALIDIDKINEWFFKLENFKPEVGFAFSFSGNDNGTIVVHECVVKEIIPGKKLSYSFIYAGYPDADGTVTYELFQEGEQTRFRLTHSGLEKMAAGSPQYAREKFLGGWTYLANKLNTFLENNKITTN